MMGAFYESSPSYGLATVESESSPWQTSQAPGMSLEGTLGQQANESWGMGAPQPGNPFGLEDALTIAGQQQAPPDPIASLGAFQAQMVQSRQEEPPPIGSITRKADGTTDLKGVSSQFLEDVMGQMTDLKTMKAAAMARVAQLRQQEQSGSPLLDALSQFAGGMAANDPTMPGWVRALGATSLAMGPQGIKRERMAEEQKALQYGQAGASLAQQMLDNQRADQALEIQAINAYGNVQSKSLARQDKLDAGLDSVTKDLERLAKDRIDLTPDDITKRLSMRGDYPPEQSAVLSEYYSKLRAAADTAYDEARKDKLSDRETAGRVNLALQTVLAERRNDMAMSRAKELTDYRQGAMLNRQKEMLEFSTATKDLEPFRKLTTPQQTQLNDMTTNLEYLKSLRQVVNDPKTSQYLGPLNLARISGEWSTLFRPEELQTVMTYFAHELPRVAKFTGAQSRAFTAAMVPVIKSLGGETSMTPGQMNKVMDIIEESTQQIQIGIAKSKPLAPFNLAPGMLGGVTSPAYKAWVDAHEIAQKQGMGKTTSAAPDQAQKALSASVGAIVPLTGADGRVRNYKKFGPNDFRLVNGGK